MRYSIDTSALLDGWKRHYPPDLFPALWVGIEELIEADELAATEEVLFELQKRDDEVHAWAVAHQRMFRQIDRTIQPVVSTILSKHPRLVAPERAARLPTLSSSPWP